MCIACCVGTKRVRNGIFYLFFFIFFFNRSIILSHLILILRKLPSTIFTTCQEHDIDNCDASTNTQQYLGCYVSNWRTCRDEVGEKKYC